MLPEKQICSSCGSDDMVMNGRFGAGGTWVCRECGAADVALESEPGEDDDLEMPAKKSKFKLIGGDSEDLNESAEFDNLGEPGVNLIKANRAKTPKVTKISKTTKTKVSKGRKKK